MNLLESHKAVNMISIATGKQSDLIDCMVIATGTSNRHVQSLASYVISEAKKQRIGLVGYEGLEDCQWVLIDLGDTLVHIMQSETRDYYQLERLWQPFARDNIVADTTDTYTNLSDINHSK